VKFLTQVGETIYIIKPLFRILRSQAVILQVKTSSFTVSSIFSLSNFTVPLITTQELTTQSDRLQPNGKPPIVYLKLKLFEKKCQKSLTQLG
jgi:hypothetical protein